MFLSVGCDSPKFFSRGQVTWSGWMWAVFKSGRMVITDSLRWHHIVSRGQTVTFPVMNKTEVPFVIGGVSPFSAHWMAPVRLVLMNFNSSMQLSSFVPVGFIPLLSAIHAISSCSWPICIAGVFSISSVHHRRQ